MIQSFQCPQCGNWNIIGEPSCAKCGQNFVYNCPVCGHPVSNSYNNCPGCNTAFYWNKAYQQNYEMSPVGNPLRQLDEVESKASLTGVKEQREAQKLSTTQRPMFWVMLMIVSAAMIVVLLFIDRIINS